MNNIGEFKPRRRFLGFISTVSKVRFIRNHAFIDGKFLSNMIEDLKFKITIFDDGTINFEEVNNKSDKVMINRLISIIDDTNVTGFSNKFVVNGLEFKDDDGNVCYLEVDHVKPIDKLKNIGYNKRNISKTKLNALDKLFLKKKIKIDDEVINSDDNDDNYETYIENKVNSSFYNEEFTKMKEEQVKILQDRIEDRINDKKLIIKQNVSNDEKIKSLDKEIKLLEHRLDSLNPDIKKNGYIFNISEAIKYNIEIDSISLDFINKISNILGFKKDSLINLLKESYYEIRIAHESDITKTIFNKEILNLIKVEGKFTIKEDYAEYRGELSWHEIVNKFIKCGFSQNPEFNKLSGSNSYV